MKVVLNSKGKEYITKIDDEIIHFLNNNSLKLEIVIRSNNPNPYVVAQKYLSKKNGKSKYFRKYLHRLIMNASSNELVDHIDGNSLNNLKTNLRKCNSQQNSANQKIRSNNTTGYKGVTVCKNRFRASVTFNYKRIHIGLFKTAEQAANAYNLKAIELFGEFARINEVKNGTA